ncbi:hypothetical protein [Streptomyces sp. NPDC051109]|uniref:hypothetical protein n=1 Tax=Streptomyces sp. NPDC051109 TaxID=3365642 RepID=UPI0037ABA5B3
MTYDEFLRALPADQARLALYDLPFVTSDGTRHHQIVSICWLPASTDDGVKPITADPRMRSPRRWPVTRCPSSRQPWRTWSTTASSRGPGPDTEEASRPDQAGDARAQCGRP